VGSSGKLKPIVVKHFRLPFVTALITFGIGLTVSWMLNGKPTTSHNFEVRSVQLVAHHPCTHDKLVVKQPPDASARLSVLEASCDKPASRVVLAIENVGAKPIRGYEVGSIQQFEQKRDVESSQAAIANGGITLAVGETRTLNFGGGFENNESCGRPTGSHLQSVFWIKSIEYTDGSRSLFSNGSP
jgi:hypothetical protein